VEKSYWGSLTPAQLYARIFGVVYAAVGVAGVLISDQSFFGGDAGDKLIVFPINYAHDIIHLVIGFALIWGSMKAALAPKSNLAVGVVLALVAVLGFIGVLTPDLINDHGVADDFLHLATAILAIYFGTAGAGTSAPAAPAAPTT